MRKLSRSDNGVKLRIDDDDDLWTLARICRDGTSAGLLSHRRDSTTGTQEGGRSKQAERKPMWIVLRVEESSFQPFTDNLRLHGVISEAPIDVGSYHTHTIEPGDEIELGMDVMIRTLQGQSPMIQSILVGPATKNFDEISEILNEDCDRNSTGWDNPGMDKWAPKEYVEAFFENPSDPTKYDPKSH